MTHSPEPWTPVLNFDLGRWEIDHAANGSVCDAVLSELDAIRIVACINFCRELDTAFLEAHRLKNPVPAEEWAGGPEESFVCWAAVVMA